MNQERTLRGKTLLITGASRGIGKAIGMRAARDGANIVLAAKTTKPHAKLPGTIYSAAEEMTQAGGHTLAVKTDVRHEEDLIEAIQKGVDRFGGLDIIVNNASVISLTGTANTTEKMLDRMWSVNARGSYLLAKYALPYLEKSENPHILNLSPPLNLAPHHFQGHAAYTAMKYNMSFWVLGMSEELRPQGIAVNALWPKTTIATAAVRNLLGGEPMVRVSRHPSIVADAAWAILTRPSRMCTGRFFLDEEVLREEGMDDFTDYAIDPSQNLHPDLFLD